MWIPELESDEGSTATNKAKEALLFLSPRRRRRRLSSASLSSNVK
jgi:hypothetical protein